MAEGQFQIVSKKEKKITFINSIIIVILMSASISISTAMFLNPLKLYAGGVTGIAQILLHFFGIIVKGPEGWHYYDGYLGLVNFALFLPFNVLAYFKLSKKYALYTSISTIVQSIVLSFPTFWENLYVFRNDNGYDILACALVAGFISGLCNGVLMRRGATSGGIITLCQYLNLKKGKSVGFINLIVSGSIMIFGAIASFLSQGDDGAAGIAISTALYTFINFLISSIVLDWVHTSYNKIKLEIVTEKGDDLAAELIQLFPHGVTIEKGVGAFSKREKTILNVIIQNYETGYYLKAIKEIDENAFISIMPCRSTYGKFTQRVIDK